ncbi:MAG: hypothetical protein WCV86_00090 [Patescibacteria group bacterium]|jgi:hypothetical protein
MTKQQTKKKPQAKISSFPARAGLFLLVLTVMLGGAIMYFVLGSTTITVTREPMTTSRSFPVVIEEEPSQESTGDSAHVAGIIVHAEVEVSDTFIPASEPQITEQPATGTVTIYNNWSQTQPLAATTRLLAEDGTLFRILDRIDVPAGGSVTSPIYADVAGEAGEIGPTRFTIPGLWAGLQDMIYAESTTATTGGTVEIKLLTDADLATAQEALTEKAKEAAADTLRTQEIPVDLAFEQSSITTDLIDEERSAELGEQVETFTLTRTESITALALDTVAIKTLALAELERTLESALVLTEDDVTFTVELPERIDALPLQITVTATGNALLTANADILDPVELVSRSEARIQEYFTDVPGIATVDVRFSPFWVTRAPSNPAQITVVVK